MGEFFSVFLNVSQLCPNMQERYKHISTGEKKAAEIFILQSLKWPLCHKITDQLVYLD